VDCCCVGGIPVCDEGELLIGECGADGLGHGNGSGQHLSVIGEVVSGDFKGFGGDEEEDEVVFALDLDIGFIFGGDRINGAFALEIEEVAVVSSGLSVVEHGLVGDRDVKDIAQNEGGFSGGDCAGDVEGQDEAQDI
jgi:hypothetical protein